jgi:hypothetical protein
MFVKIGENALHYRRDKEVGDGSGSSDLDVFTSVADAAKAIAGPAPF